MPLYYLWRNKYRHVCLPEKGGCGKVHPYFTATHCVPAAYLSPLGPPEDFDIAPKGMTVVEMPSRRVVRA
jgi:hypothetical protein